MSAPPHAEHGGLPMQTCSGAAGIGPDAASARAECANPPEDGGPACGPAGRWDGTARFEPAARRETAALEKQAAAGGGSEVAVSSERKDLCPSSERPRCVERGRSSSPAALAEFGTPAARAAVAQCEHTG